MNNKKEIKKFSKDDGSLEVLQDSPKPSTGRDLISNKSGNNIVIGTLNVVAKPVMDRHEKHYKESTFHLIADIILVLAVVMLSVSIYFIKNLDLTRSVEMSIELGNESVSSGRFETFDIYYENNSKAKIEEVSISVKLPDYFTLLEYSPEDLYDYGNKTFHLRDLESGAGGKVTVRGVLMASVGSQKFISTSLNYSQNGSEKNVLKSLDFSVDSSELDINVTLPEVVYQGSPFVGTIEIDNGFHINPIGLELIFERDVFSFLSAEGEDVEFENNIIWINKINDEDLERIVFEAKVENENIKKISFDTFLYHDPFSYSDDNIKLGSFKGDIAIKKPKFNTQIVNDVSAMSVAEKINYRVNYKNNEDLDVENVQYKILSSNKNFKIKKIIIENRIAEVDLKNNILKIGKLEAGESGSVSFSVLFERLRAATEQGVGIMLASSYDIDSNNVTYNIYSKTNKLLSSTIVSSLGYYYSSQGDQLGIGPVPPIVSIPTNYWIFWEVDNLGNNLEDFIMTAKVPSNVSLTGNKTLLSGSYEYIENDREIMWVISNISKEGGKNMLGFEVSYTPSINDAGKIKTILNNANFSYNDNFCDKVKSGTSKSINTRLSNDKNVLTDGVVVDLDI